ncbi:MAG TPA: VOC family protein [Terriglobia bacterium]|nr:VOC family protein [Terriglobia bacterium]
MLGSAKLMTFVPTRDAPSAKAFYAAVLGLRLVSEDPFALVFDANGIMLRVTNVPEFKPQAFTVLGWPVSNIESAVADLGPRGVNFEKYGFQGQDERGIWTAPGGAKIAWFKDPDGNVLSVTQFP